MFDGAFWLGVAVGTMAGLILALLLARADYDE